MTTKDNAKSSTSKIGEAIDYEGKPFMVRLPGGTVVTARGTYTFQHEGEHAAIVDGKETTIKVEKA